MTPVEQRADEYRVKLGMMPWSDFTAQQLKRLEELQWRSPEEIRVMKLQRRQCGKTTRGLFLAIAEAEFSGWDLLVIGFNHTHTEMLKRNARDLIQRLELEVGVRTSTIGNPVIVFVDHMAGYAASVPRWFPEEPKSDAHR